jgi:hypothetical protein
MKHPIYFLAILLFSSALFGQSERTNNNKFKQLKEELPTPNVYRTASGSPGPKYWQQQADYEMEIVLDDTLQRIYGEETITYYNNSPNSLEYIWLQLDQNVRAKTSDTYKIRTGKISEESSLRSLKRLSPWFDGGFKIDFVKDEDGKDLVHVVNKTMMRIDPEKPIQAGEKFVFKLKWWYNIQDRMKLWGRSGYEYFNEDGNYLYTIAQFFPRMCVYNDIEGWQNKQFLGRGEFTLPFGNYDVKITVPEDHLVSATGILQNEKDVMAKEKRDLLEKARSSYKDPIIIYSEQEAIDREKSKSYKTKTWHFKAENVRDFAFASSRKFIWDAMAVKIDGKNIMAMSMYPKEGNPLWERYSTKVVAHTLKWYSHYTIDYPYPVAWSINAARIGMEYPMICFNYGRTEEDGSYSERTKYGMISVIIHEVGHNFFPMIINSDERQWTWMDEGLNTFVQFLTEQEWEPNYPSRRGFPHKITDYMGGDPENLSPIMTNSESIHQFGNNAYGKPATALNILRETVMGRELFDYAFKTYSERWKFKHPSPADFFRTMEDASAVDLDWFWRGWFYTTEYVDMSIAEVDVFKLEDPDLETISKDEKKARDNIKPITEIRNEEEGRLTYAEKDSSLIDFYSTYDPLDIEPRDREAYQRFKSSLSEEEKELLNETNYYYEITFKNKGGLVMPLIIQFKFEDGSDKVVRIPAEIWRLRHDEVTKVFPLDKVVEQIVLDPFYELADVDREDNYYPQLTIPSRFELFEKKADGFKNPMQRNRAIDKQGGE